MLAVLVGLTMAGVAIVATGARVDLPISLAFPNLAYEIGYGKNVVNVALVDLRGWDTMGELSVVVLAATGVWGDFVLPRTPAPVLLVAAGIGVTPFVSQLRHDHLAGIARDTVLVYVAAGADDVVFRDELARTGVPVVVFTREDPGALPAGWRWAGGSRLDAAALRSAVPDLSARHAYISGPAALIADLAPALASAKSVATDAFSGEAVAEGTCIHAADPTSVALGISSTLDIIGSSVVGADGAWQIDGLTAKPALGAVVLLADCPAEDGSDVPATFYPSATGISTATYTDLGDGDIADGLTAYKLNNDALSEIDAELTASGAGTFTEPGGLIYMLRDPDSAPVSNAAVYCGEDPADGLCPVYYNSGLGTGTYGISFSDADGAPLTVTGADGLAALPAATVTTYNIDHDTYTFAGGTRGSLEGLAFFVESFGSVE